MRVVKVADLVLMSLRESMTRQTRPMHLHDASAQSIRYETFATVTPIALEVAVARRCPAAPARPSSDVLLGFEAVHGLAKAGPRRKKAEQ